MTGDLLRSGNSRDEAEIPTEYRQLRDRCQQLESLLESSHRQQAGQRHLHREIVNTLRQHSSDVIVDMTTDGRVRSVNRAGQRLAGAQLPDPWADRAWVDLWSEDDRQTAEAALKTALQGKPALFRGRWRWVATGHLPEATIAPVLNLYGKPESLIAVICERGSADRDTTASEHSDTRFHALADHMAQLAWMADESGSVYWYNRRWFAYTGTTLEEMQGWGWCKVHHPDHLERVVHKIRGAYATGQVWEDTFPLRHKDGKYRWFLSRAMPIRDASGKVVRWFGTATDITRQLMTQTRLRESEDKLRLGIAVARVAISEVNYATQTAELSPRAAEMYGLSGDQLVVPRTVLRDLIHPEDLPLVRRLVEDAQQGIASGKIQFEHRIIRPSDRQVRWLRVNQQVFFDTDETGQRKPVSSLLAAHDITGQKNVQSEQERARHLAEQASRAKSDFLANMSHEIRTPMTAILGYADILKRHLNNPDDLNCVNTIRRNGFYLLDIINDILDLSKIEEGRLEIESVGFSLVELVEETRSLMDVRAYEKRIPLRVEYETLVPNTIHCDPTRLRQILVNLVANAIKFTERGGVRLAVRYLPETDIIDFSVIDSGIGIAAEEVDRLFQPFTQADSSTTRRYGGSGLGLTISQRLAHLLGGEIHVQSQLERGSTFTLSIRARAAAEGNLVDPANALPDEQILDAHQLDDCVELTCHTLVVDDRRDVRFLVQYIIEEAGGMVSLAKNGEDALDVIARSSTGDAPPIDLVLMDLQMPRMGGLEATRRLRASGFDRPIVALTANAMKGDRETCLAAGCTDYLTKPIDCQLLLETIARHTGNSSPPLRSGAADSTRFREPPGRCLAGKRIGQTGQPALDEGPADPAAGRRVLLVEDHADAGRMLQEYLQMDGHQVRLAANGQQAIRLAADDPPEVVVMDIGLPDMCGLQVAQTLRQQTALADVRMIALTGRDERTDAESSLAAGFDFHLGKPADLTRLEQLVRETPPGSRP